MRSSQENQIQISFPGDRWNSDTWDKCQGPKLKKRTRTSDDLYPFIANYAAKSYGMSFINKWLENNKDRSLLYLTKECDLADAITLIKNHGPVWERDHFKETLEDDKLNKYDNCKELEDHEEIEKYSPEMQRFSAGIGVKRIFGSVVWNKEGVTFYESTNKMWKEALFDGEVWEWLCNIWNTWVINSNSGKHWRKKTKNESMNNMDDNEEGAGDFFTDGPVEVLLPDNEDFDYDRGQSRMPSPIENDHLRSVGGDLVARYLVRYRDSATEWMVRYGMEGV